jgi:hypothetical protein
VPATVRLDQIVWNGGCVDCIPTLDTPQLAPASQAAHLAPEELVFGVEINGDARAYPLRLIGQYELLNDVVGGVPITLVYSPSSGTAILYETMVKGTTYTFGSSGLFAGSDKLIYDRQTDSLWDQTTGQPVTGVLAGRGVRLSRRPVALDTWANWLADHPGTHVLSMNEPQ